MPQGERVRVFFLLDRGDFFNGLFQKIRGIKIGYPNEFPKRVAGYNPSMGGFKETNGYPSPGYHTQLLIKKAD